MAVEDETTVSRRGTSSRGGRKPPTKKESNSNSTANKKSVEAANNKYSSEESSDVSDLHSIRDKIHDRNILTLINQQDERSKSTKAQPAKRRKKAAILSDSD